ncbi:hypothetical protein N9S31_01020, partial [bacterium]|nr:hypothetical protein [bacterium]
LDASRAHVDTRTSSTSTARAMPHAVGAPRGAAAAIGTKRWANDHRRDVARAGRVSRAAGRRASASNSVTSVDARVSTVPSHRPSARRRGGGGERRSGDGASGRCGARGGRREGW